jgi:DNA-binding NarL/FixJ family response regulator
VARIELLIADDHAVVRDGLSLVVGSEPDMRVVALASNGEEALDAALAHCPDIALLDMRMPKLGGIAAIRALRERCPATKVLVLSMYDDEHVAAAALSAGAQGYVGKHAPSSTLLRAIRAVHRGERFFEDGAQDTAHAPSTALSAREREVMALIVAGYTGRAIADKLGIAKSSADTYRARVFQKLGVSDRAELIARSSAKHEL